MNWLIEPTVTQMSVFLLEADPGPSQRRPVQPVFVEAQPNATDDRVDHHRRHQNEARDE
jgi:hypothetical protein